MSKVKDKYELELQGRSKCISEISIVEESNVHLGIIEIVTKMKGCERSPALEDHAQWVVDTLNKEARLPANKLWRFIELAIAKHPDLKELAIKQGVAGFRLLHNGDN